MNAPFFEPGYSVSPNDTLINVTENDSSFYVEFVYVDISTGIDDQQNIPVTWYLKQNYPNPFNPVTRIEYGLPESGAVTIDIYNVSGQKVDTILDEHKKAGNHSVIWNSADLSTGVYFYKIKAGKFETVKKAVLIK